MRLRLRRETPSARNRIQVPSQAGHDPQRQPVKAAAAATAAAATLRQPLGSFSGSFFFLPSKQRESLGQRQARIVTCRIRVGGGSRVGSLGVGGTSWAGNGKTGHAKKKGHVEVPFSPGSPSVSIARHVNTGLGTESCTGDGGSETAD